MDEQKIEPALTAEEWAERFGYIESYTPPPRPHARAAVYLYGQPFGFTWDDVELVRVLADSSDEFPATAALADFLADRIAALLPPR